MKLSDRRLARRFGLSIPLYFRAWKSQAQEQRVKSVNVSERGVYFETDAPPRQGAMIQLRLEMPTEITGNPPNEWRCAGKVLRIHPGSSPGAPQGVSVRFDYYEILRSPAKVAVLGSGDKV
jgi:PilZ domain